MIKLTLIASCFTVSCLLNMPTQLNAQPPLDSIFVCWNNFTFESLKKQTQSTVDSLQKSRYENRLLSVKEYWRIKNIDDFNNTSIRYKLLKTVFLKTNRQKDFYIIEANETDSKILLRSIVSADSKIKKVLDGYRKGNVIK